MRAGPACLQFDWSRVGLSMDLPVFVFSHTKTSLKFLSGQGGYIGQLFMWLQIFYFKPRRENLTGLLFCPDVRLSRSIDHRDRNICIHYYLVVSNHQAVRPATFSFI